MSVAKKNLGMDELLVELQFLYLLVQRGGTWCILEDEERKFSIQFPSDSFCLIGDFSGYVGVTRSFDFPSCLYG